MSGHSYRCRRYAPSRQYRIVVNAKKIKRIRHLIAVWSLGGLAIGLITWVCFQLGVNVTTAVLAYLIVLVVVSLIDSPVSSVVLSALAVLCLNYFFLEPIFSFGVASGQDLLVLIVFVFTSLVITGLVRRIRALGDAHRDQAQLLDLTQDPIFVRNINDVIIYWNRGAEQLYGWSEREALGQVTHNLLQTDFPAPLEQIKTTLLNTGRWEGEVAHVKRDGTQVVVSSRWSLQRDEYGTPIGTLETNNDITARKRAQELLYRSQEAYLAAAQKLSSTGSFGWNVSNGEISWSEETYRIFGYQRTMSPSIDLVLQRIHPDDVAFVRATILDAASSRVGFDIEHRLKLPDGSIKNLHVVVRPMTEEANASQFVGAVMDVTAAKQAEEQLQRAQSDLAHVSRVTSLGELTASIAHEVNQPLAAIVTNGELSFEWLTRDNPPLGDVSEALTEIIDDGRRASDIVQRIRALVRRSERQKSAVDCNKVVEGIVPLIRRELSDHRVSLRLDLAQGLSSVFGDRVQLEQVVLNLVINGIQAMATVHDRPRSLTIESRQTETGEVLVSVQDSGIGIAPENVSRLFDAFFTTKPNGLGMGLAICRSIIEAHEGQLSAAAAEEGPGSIFRFRLPPATQMSTPRVMLPSEGT
jgi:PAS domain S-box-containing protein